MVHRFLRSIGFSSIKNRKDMTKLIKIAIANAEKKSYTSIDEDDILYAEYYYNLGENFGLCVRGEYDENNKFIYDYSFPFLKGREITTYEEVSVDRHLEKLSYAGVVDDFKIGISIIFYLQEIVSYLKYYYGHKLPLSGTGLTLTGLSDEGTILMPIAKNDLDVNLSNIYHMRKSRMLRDAVEGDEQAIESLTMNDYDTQKVLQKKVQEEDVLSLVDTYFMPYGLECDLYSVLGVIVNYQLVNNTLTDEKIYIMCLDINGMKLDICVNSLDVTGELKVGRRYKGVVWLQGEINFPEE